MRSRPEFEVALLEDLEWLGFRADAGPIRQSDDDAPYAAALARLRDEGLVYGCDCSRKTFEAWAHDHGRRVARAGLPGRLSRRVDSTGRSCAWGSAADRNVGWIDSSVRARTRSRTTATRRSPTATGTGRTGSLSSWTTCARAWTSSSVAGTCSSETAAQIRLGAMLGRETPAAFAHHPLIRRPDGRKLSKADGDTSVRDLRVAGRTAAELIGEAAAAVGLIDGPGRSRRRRSRVCSTDRSGADRAPPPRLRSPQAGSDRSSISQAWSRACQAIRRAA